MNKVDACIIERLQRPSRSPKIISFVVGNQEVMITIEIAGTLHNEVSNLIEEEVVRMIGRLRVSQNSAELIP